ncbi:MAG TPA: hypothetical protein VMM92_13550 [Thermoanaerobaculia bacterium]|nr:hypothetical protein [Thermoanaerobaculia bacterium]
MEDERVDRLLRALPQVTASAGFTARVLARLDEEEVQASRIFGLPRLTLPAAVLAATLVVAASLSLQEGGRTLVRPPASHPPARLLAPVTQAATLTPVNLRASVPVSRHALEVRRAMREIRAEQGRLHADLRRLSERQGATLYLGGDEDVDLVVHLDQIREVPPDYQPYY